jgi:diguanylate cyclase (GGDEF)-like protein
MQIKPPATFHGRLVWAMAVLTVAYVAGLAALYLRWGGQTGEGLLSNLVNNWLGLLTSWMPVAVCWFAVYRVRLRRPEVLLATAAMTAYAAGDTYTIWAELTMGEVPFPSVGDVVYLSFYPLMLAALVLAVHHNVRRLASAVWLDCAVGSLGATAALAVLLNPVLSAAVTDSSWLANMAAVAYPLFDMTLLAAVAGIATLRDVRMGSRWALMVTGLLIFSAADVVYGLLVTAGTYVLGTPLDAAWAVGLALIAMWVDGAADPEEPAPQDTSSATGSMALVVSTLAKVAGLAVLAVGTRATLSTLAVSLAGVTLLAAAARSHLTFRLLAQMADLRRVAAATDELTGLPNRRALYSEGHARLLAPQVQRQALMMLDLNKFKEVNDTLGHHVGDQLLIQVADRLRGPLHDGDLLARLGGDEFAVLIGDAGHAQAGGVAIKLRAALDEPFEIGDITLRASVSIGIALFPDDGPDLSTLLRKADIAMYKAKASSIGHHVYQDQDATGRASRGHPDMYAEARARR